MRSLSILKVMTCTAALLTASGVAHAEDKSPWMVRVRAIDVVPHESSTVSIGGQALVGDSIVPELDISYFWTENIATELILATTKHNVFATNTALGDLGLGHVWLLPPTLTMQYHFAPDASFRPYIGAGINYTIFYSETPGDVNSISYKNKFGWALQAGVDIPVNDDWSFNIDAKKLFLSTDVSINSGAVTANVDINPWILGVGFGYRF
ncbi:OmpW/AlkL family protein [Kordiimonas marina]|uniref:OmpW/AlkL family protein n=1 Tax=Kordiimonas marina TaxID=2872312 RepID=UPI001FF225FD|nr:OmpW family protein [Kordiimonas marina]MCJ9427746.1 OmpW family protein [Kordiimonas marina]